MKDFASEQIGYRRATVRTAGTGQPPRWPLMLPVKVISEANRREHWAVAHRRRQGQRGAVAAFMARYVGDIRRMAGAATPDAPLVVTLWAMTPQHQRPMDSDNLVRSLKAVRDEIAVVAGLDDGDQRVRWEYHEGSCGGKEYWVMVSMR